VTTPTTPAGQQENVTPQQSDLSRRFQNGEFPFNTGGILMFVGVTAAVLCTVIGVVVLRRRHYRRIMKDRRMNDLLKFGNPPAIANAHLNRAAISGGGASPPRRGSPPPLAQYNRSGASANQQSTILPPPPAMTVSPARQKAMAALTGGRDSTNPYSNPPVRYQVSPPTSMIHGGAGASQLLPLPQTFRDDKRMSATAFDKDFSFVGGNSMRSSTSTTNWLDRLRHNRSSGKQQPDNGVRDPNVDVNRTGTLHGNDRPWL
jgi:hypothetical protein